MTPEKRDGDIFRAPEESLFQSSERREISPSLFSRQAYLDRARGIAVLIMIEAHVLDAWTLGSERGRAAFGQAMVFGGFAAPLFLFLAGVGVALSAGSKYRRTGDLKQAWRTVRNRGWQIFGLAFLFRLQSYLLSGGSSLLSLLKVDILNIMGPAMALASVVGGMVGSDPRTDLRQAEGTPSPSTGGVRPRLIRLTVAFGCLTIGIAMATPLVRTTSLLSWLPNPLEWYFQPRPGSATFTLFPWAGFVFAGAVVGALIDEDPRTLRLQVWLFAAAVVVGFGAYGASFLPSIYPQSQYWTTSPTFFFVRVAVVTGLLPVAYAWEQAPWRGVISRWSPVVEIGRSSLFVYWIHVEMVYGLVSRPLRRALPFELAVLADVLFSAFVLALVLLKNRIVSVRKAGAVPAAGVRSASI